MRKLEPHPVVGNPGQHRMDKGNDPASRRALIAVRARRYPKEKFNNLLHHLTYELVEECLNRTPMTSAVGMDGMTVRQARENLHWLLPPILKQIHEGRYEPPPVRRVYIQKPDGRQRPIGVPTVLDRAIQAAMAKILEEIYEQDFLVCSFGFRPGLSCHHALATINEIVGHKKLNHVLEVDLRDFFGSLDHQWMRKFLEHRISDPRVLGLINAWLKAGIIEQGRWQKVENGTPQGGSLSPLLANIYLHYVVDLWFDKRIKKQLKGRAYLVRYADDFAIFFSNAQEVEEVNTLLQARLAQFGLEIADEKTHKTDLSPRERKGKQGRRRMTFLGFNIFQARNRKGTGWKMVFQTEGKRFSRAKARMKQILSAMMHQDREKQAQRINSLLDGHFQYYGIAGNWRKLVNFWNDTVRYWRRCLSRRSQHGKVSWDSFHQYLEKRPVLRPRIRISYPHLAYYVRL